MGVEKWVSGKTQHPSCLHQSRTTAAIEYTHNKIKDLLIFGNLFFSLILLVLPFGYSS
jgi:hypothetical protein